MLHTNSSHVNFTFHSDFFRFIFFFAPHLITKWQTYIHLHTKQNMHLYKKSSEWKTHTHTQTQKNTIKKMFFRVFILLHTKVYLLLSIMHKCDQTLFARVFMLKMDGGSMVAYLQALQTHRTFLYLLPRIMATEVKGMRNLFYGSDSMVPTLPIYIYKSTENCAIIFRPVRMKSHSTVCFVIA